MDEANVDIPSSVESSSQRIRELEAWVGSQVEIMTEGFEIDEIGVEEGVDRGHGFKDLFCFSIWCCREGGRELFHHSMLSKWTTSVAYSTWIICKWISKFNCVMSLKWSWVRRNVAKHAFQFGIPTITQASRHLATTCYLLVCPPRPQLYQACHSLVDSTPNYGGQWV